MKEHKETIVFCIVTLIGNLLPLLLGLLYYSGNSEEWAGWNIFYRYGQFYLYSASLLTSSAYIFYTYKVKNTDLNSILLLISGLSIFIVSVLYGWKISNSINELVFIKYSSIIAFVITLILYYYSNLLNNKKIDVIGAQKKAVQDILNKL